MRTSRPRYRARQSEWGLIGIAIGLLVVVAVAFAALAYFYLSAQRDPKLDSATLCPVDGPYGIVVVIVDTSDDLPETTKRQALGLVNDQINDLPAFYKLDIRVLDFQNARSRSLFAKCNPGNGVGLSEWTANPRIARERWIESFRKPAREAMDSSLQSSKANSSPIMAAIQDVAIAEFTSAASQKVAKRLIVISDMIEHTNYYSQYPRAGDLSYDRFKRSPAYLKFRTDLHNAQVKVEYVQRLAPNIDTVKLMEFWREWVDENRGSFGGARRLQGAG